MHALTVDVVRARGERVAEEQRVSEGLVGIDLYGLRIGISLLRAGDVRRVRGLTEPDRRKSSWKACPGCN